MGTGFLRDDNMPTKRILLTLYDVKEMIAKKYKSHVEKIEIFEANKLQFKDCFLDQHIDIYDDSYLFQYDEESEQL